MEAKPLIIEQILNAPVELVWRAITEKELMKKWYFDIPDFKLDLGKIFHFEGEKEGSCYLHVCEILEIIPLKKLKHSWKYKGYSGLSFVTFELFPMENKTKLKLTHEGLETLPSHNPDFARENFVGGWNYLVHESLFEYLNNGKAL